MPAWPDIPLAERLMVALDVDELSQAAVIAEDLKGLDVTFKIGNQLGTYEGWQRAIQFAKSYRARVFCDTKFKDIPATVERSCRAITRHQPDFFNVMADNNPAALEAAVRGTVSAMADFRLGQRPLLLGVTVLTSINNEEAVSLYGAPAADKVRQFATQAAQAGFDGLICSPQEAAGLRQQADTKHLLLVTPGVRPDWAASSDQRRTATPRMALQNGADYVVIGRPITRPPAKIGSPRQAALKVLKEMEEA